MMRAFLPVLLLGMLAGSRDLLQPLDVFKGGTSGSALAAEQHGLKFEKVKDVAALDGAGIWRNRHHGHPCPLDQRLGGGERGLLRGEQRQHCVGELHLGGLERVEPGAEVAPSVLDALDLRA